MFLPTGNPWDLRASKNFCTLKDAAGFLAPFHGLAKRILTVPITGAHEAPRDPSALAEIARALGFDADACPSVRDALARLAREQTGAARVLICGSLYLAGNVLADDAGVAQQSN